MILKRWLYRYRDYQLRRRLRKSKFSPWDQLLIYASHVDEALLVEYSPRTGLRHTLEVVHPNALELCSLLSDATDICISGGYVGERIQKSRTKKSNLTTRTLDDYLTAPNGAPLHPVEVLAVLRPTVSALQAALLTVALDSSQRHSYYLRQFTHLLEETTVFLKTLVEVAKYGTPKEE